MTITDDDPAGTVQFSQLSYAVVEGGTATITVTRTGTAGPVSVSFATSNGTATQPSDYTATAGTFTFQAGETTKTFIVTTATDALTEGNESVNLTLSSPTNGLLLGNPSAATLWILDVQQTVQFATSAYSVTEGGFVNVLVTRAGVPDGTVTVNYQVSGASTAAETADFTLTPGQGTLTFLPGITTLPIKVQAINDTLLEGPESLVLVLSNPSGGASLGAPTTTQVTLFDNERPDLVVTSMTGPMQAATGLPMTIVATVQNLTGGLAPATSLGVFLSPSSNTPGAGVRIGLVAIPSLTGGASYTASAPVTVPLGLAAGDYFLSAMADALGVATEEVETNNGLTVAAQVTIVIVQPDLVVSTITGPVSMPRGKPVAIPMTVRNLGAVASGPYRVGVFVSESADPTVAAATGTLLGITDMPTLAPGASAAVSTSITPPVTLPQGAYWVSAVADLNRAISEPNEINNGFTAFAASKIVRPLNKLTRAAMSLTPSGCGDVSGQAINLGGAFVFTTIGASTANGTLDLTGSFNGDPTRASHFRGTFSAAFNDANEDLSLTIVFTSVTGFFTGIGSASAAGAYDGRVFEAESPDGGVTPALTGSLTGTTTGTSCTFGGSLTAIGDPAYSLTFNVSATGGAFGGAQTPTLAATPISISAFAPLFEVASDDNFPTAASLKFTGPAGSGFSTPGTYATTAATDITAAHATYQPAAVRGPSAAAGPMGGAWSVLYKAVSRAFTVANPEAPARLVILKPSVTLSGPNIQEIDWVYLDPATGATLAAPPPFVSQIQAVVQGSGGATVCVSPAFDRTTTTYTADPASDPDCQSLVPFSTVTAINMTYVDSLTGNRYTVVFSRP